MISAFRGLCAVTVDCLLGGGLGAKQTLNLYKPDLFLHIFLTGKTGKVDMFNILYATIPYMP